MLYAARFAAHSCARSRNRKSVFEFEQPFVSQAPCFTPPVLPRIRAAASPGATEEACSNSNSPSCLLGAMLYAARFAAHSCARSRNRRSVFEFEQRSCVFAAPRAYGHRPGDSAVLLARRRDEQADTRAVMAF
jgi:hypothetical protein